MTVLEYLKNRKMILFLFLLCSASHIIVLFLYDYDTEPIWYAFVIYLIIILCLGMADYIYQSRKLKRLRSYEVNIDKSLQDLILPQGSVEREYQNIISKLQEIQTDNDNTYLQKEKELSDFYTMWVHQIKTPIAALQLLLQTSPENVSAMRSELFKIERYVDIILNYLRLENINQDLLLKHYDLEVLVKQAVKKYSPLFIQSRLSLKLDDLAVSVLTDEKWLVFVMEQLLSNAIKYTKSGGISIYASTAESEGVKKTFLTLKDTGIGICPEDLPRIFERAYTGYNGRNDKKASGLGLYLCKTILQKLGHEISIASVPDEGTEVTITFYENTTLH